MFSSNAVWSLWNHMLYGKWCGSWSAGFFRSWSGYTLFFNRVFILFYTVFKRVYRDRSGSVVECLTCDQRFEPHRRHCIVSLSKTHLFWLSTGPTQENLSWHNWKIVDWDVKNQNKQTIVYIWFQHSNNWGIIKFFVCIIGSLGQVKFSFDKYIMAIKLYIGEYQILHFLHTWWQYIMTVVWLSLMHVCGTVWCVCEREILLYLGHS